MTTTPIVYLICGFIGAGKTTFAKKLEEKTGAVRITKDEWSIRLIGHDPTIEGYAEHDHRIIELSRDIAFQLVEKGIDVIIDEGFWGKQQRVELGKRIEEMGAKAVIYYLDTPIEVIRERVVARNSNVKHDSFTISRELLDHYLQFWQPPSEDEGYILASEIEKVSILRHGPAGRGPTGRGVGAQGARRSTAMAVRQSETTGAVAAAKELRARLRGTVVGREDPGYEAARRIWNGIIDKRPALIARCEGAADVVAAVEAARAHDLSLAVRGGGHNVAGHAVCDDGLVVDLSPMKRIDLDPANRIARVEPGVTWGEFDRETQRVGLATTGGLVSTTGIAGFTLGGGLGWLMRRFGLACDNLLSADVITADGSRLTANAEENADLYWGLRGGGGNFGIVTSFSYRLHALEGVLAGLVLHPWSAAREALRFYREYAADPPDELTAHALLVSSPEGEPAVAFAACWSGSAAAGEVAIAPLRSWGRPTADTIEPRAYADWQRAFDEANAPGRRNYWKSSVPRRLDDGLLDALVERFPAVPSPSSSVLIEGLGGAVTRVVEEATAYPHRDAAHDVLISSVWDDPEADGANVGWARDAFAAIEPYAREAVYVNYLGDEGTDRVRAAYGAAKHDRLVALKDRYDPTNVFRLNQNIRPSVG